MNLLTKLKHAKTQVQPSKHRFMPYSKAYECQQKFFSTDRIRVASLMSLDSLYQAFFSPFEEKLRSQKNSDIRQNSGKNSTKLRVLNTLTQPWIDNQFNHYYKIDYQASQWLQNSGWIWKTQSIFLKTQGFEYPRICWYLEKWREKSMG